MQPLLETIRLIDFSRLLPGPLGSSILASMGVEVIRFEDPDYPDDTKMYPPFLGKTPLMFESLHQNKEIRTIKFSEASVNEDFTRLLQTSDILVEQFKPGRMEKFGLGIQKIREINPGLVVVSLTGFGSQDSRPGHDLNFMAESGILSLIRDTRGKPVIPMGQIADTAGAYALVQAVLAGYIHKLQTGRGVHITLSMTDAVKPFGLLPYLWKKYAPEHADLLSGSLPNYAVYECSDGRYVALGALEPPLWRSFCLSVGKPEWIVKLNHPGFSSEVEEEFRKEPAAYWIEKSSGTASCLSLVKEIIETEHKDMVQLTTSDGKEWENLNFFTWEITPL